MKSIGMSALLVVSAWECKCKDSFEACHEILFNEQTRKPTCHGLEMLKNHNLEWDGQTRSLCNGVLAMVFWHITCLVYLGNTRYLLVFHPLPLPDHCLNSKEAKPLQRHENAAGACGCPALLLPIGSLLSAPILPEPNLTPTLQACLADTSHFIQQYPNQQCGTEEKFPLFSFVPR